MEKTLQAADQQEKKTENITYKELNKAIKKLKRKKSLGTDEIPNETFIEANKDTREMFRTALNRIHEKEEIPESWQLGHIRRLYKGKGIKGKCSNERGITLASNPGKLYERIINERVKKTSPTNRGPSRRNPGKRYLRPPHNPGSNNPRNPWRKENSIHHIPGRTEGLW